MTNRTLEGIAAIVAALVLTAPPVRAQLPSMSDVDLAHERPADGPLPEWDVASLKPHPAEPLG
jgi:hypothetical protein